MVLTSVLQILAALALLFAAGTATFRPQRFIFLTGLIPQNQFGRATLATLLWLAFVTSLAGLALPFLAFFASCIAFICSIFLAILAMHFKNAMTWIFLSALAILSIWIAMLQPLGLKVMALPRADDLPYHPSPAKVVKTYEEGLWFEGIAAGDDGTLYLSGNRNLNFSRTDYYREAQGELIERKSDGSEHIIFRTSKGLTSGVPLLSRDQSIYLTSHGDTSYLWRIDRTNGKSTQMTQFPKGAWPNGLDEGPDGMLYTPDSSLGCIWRIDPQNGQAVKAISDPALWPDHLFRLHPAPMVCILKGGILLSQCPTAPRCSAMP